MTERLGTLIVGGAPVPEGRLFYERLVRDAGSIIAADAGLELCLAAGRVPDVCVGDFDSASPESLAHAASAGARIVRLPIEKDLSDLDAAAVEARTMRAAEVIVTAAFSARLDHTLAAVGTLLRLSDLQAAGEEPGCTIHPVDSDLRPVLMLEEAEGTLLSVFAVSGAAVVSIGGVRYPLAGKRLDPLSSLGLSNVVAEARQTVRAHTGRLIVVVGGHQ